MPVMDKFQAIMEKTLIPVADKLGRSKILRAISGGFACLLPVVMVGAIASLLSGLSIEPYQNFIASIGLKDILAYIPNYTTNMMALFVAFTIGKAMAEQLECKDQSTVVGVATLLCFLLTIPLGVTAGETTVAGALSTTYFGAPGIFTAMIVGCGIPNIYNVFIKKKIVIKMPDGVPPQIANGFSGIIPAVTVVALVVALRQIVTLTSFGTINDLIYGLLRAPLSTLTQSPLTFVILLCLCNVLWFFGIHGGMVVMAFLTILYQVPTLENLSAYAAGDPIPNMLCQTWWFVQAQLGGSGGAIGLAFIMVLFARSQRYKQLGKLAIAPALCSISEPLVFGFPLMLNVTMFIPMLISPLVCFGLSYLLTAIGILPYLNGVSLSTGTPIVLAGALTGGWRTAIWQIVLVVIQAVMYFPFFKIMDKQAVAEEAAAAAPEATA